MKHIFSTQIVLYNQKIIKTICCVLQIRTEKTIEKIEVMVSALSNHKSIVRHRRKKISE